MTSDESRPIASVEWERIGAIPIGFFAAVLSWDVFREPLTPGAGFWLAVVAFLSYLTLALALNRANFFLVGTHLVVSHRPIPWPGSEVLRSAVVAVEARTVMDLETDVAGFRLYAVDAKGELVSLVGAMAGGLHYRRLAEAGRHVAEALGVPFR